MNSFGLCRDAVSIGAAAALLAACGGSQPPIFSAGAIPQAPAIAQTSSGYHVLAQFPPNSADGDDPQGQLLDVNGTLFGTTVYGGTDGNGTVYTIGVGGAKTVLYHFPGGSNGANPVAGLIDVAGMLYGTTPNGGKYGGGVVYSISTSGAETVLYPFAQEPDGAGPLSGLTYANGLLYGTTEYGGKYAKGTGTVYSISTGGKEKVLHRFADFAGGIFPGPGNLLVVNGTLYGATQQGGKGCG